MDSSQFGGTLAVIGGGKMGEAIVAGLLATGTVEGGRITVAEPDESRHGALSGLKGVRIVDSAEKALPADVVIVAVKPQVVEKVFAQVGASLAGSVVVSIAAGLSTARLESSLPAGVAVVRVMPNTPAMVGMGMAVISGGAEASEAQVETVRMLFDSIGEAIVIEERFQDAATAISGSGPAYFALVIDALARAGVASGLPRGAAQALAVQTMRGTAEMLFQTAMHPEALIDGVASPGGTTIAAINRLEAAGVRAAFADAVTAAVARAKELGS